MGWFRFPFSIFWRHFLLFLGVIALFYGYLVLCSGGSDPRREESFGLSRRSTILFCTPHFSCGPCFLPLFLSSSLSSFSGFVIFLFLGVFFLALCSFPCHRGSYPTIPGHIVLFATQAVSGLCLLPFARAQLGKGFAKKGFLFLTFFLSSGIFLPILILFPIFDLIFCGFIFLRGEFFPFSLFLLSLFAFCVTPFALFLWVGISAYSSGRIFPPVTWIPGERFGWRFLGCIFWTFIALPLTFPLSFLFPFFPWSFFAAF